MTKMLDCALEVSEFELQLRFLSDKYYLERHEPSYHFSYKLNSCSFTVIALALNISLLWPWKGSLMKTQTRILDNRLYYTRKIELHRKGKKSRTVRITPILICLSGSEISQY